MVPPLLFLLLDSLELQSGSNSDISLIVSGGIVWPLSVNFMEACGNTDKMNTGHGQTSPSVSVSVCNMKHKWASEWSFSIIILLTIKGEKRVISRFA